MATTLTYQHMLYVRADMVLQDIRKLDQKKEIGTVVLRQKPHEVRFCRANENGNPAEPLTYVVFTLDEEDPAGFYVGYVHYDIEPAHGTKTEHPAQFYTGEPEDYTVVAKAIIKFLNEKKAPGALEEKES